MPVTSRRGTFRSWVARWARAAGTILGLILIPGFPSVARADDCLADLWFNGDVPARSIYPNWYRVSMGSYTAWLYQDAGPTEVVKGVTVANFGTATGGAGGDLPQVYVVMNCGATTTGTLTMTYAGVWSFDSGAHPAWTWAGSSPNFATCADLCVSPPCGAWFAVNVYADIAACPTNGATVNLGFSSNEAGDPAYPGSITDDIGCSVPWYATDVGRGSRYDTITYVSKTASSAIAAPADTVTYTIYYGKPGTGAYASRTLIDTLPPYTHYVAGSATPAPDMGWEPDYGPPARLRWTIPGGTTNGGATGMITFKVTVDWGDPLNPQSGTTVAPDGLNLVNRAQMSWTPSLSCVTDGFSDPAYTTVVRTMLWITGDNDLLISSRMGEPDDEMTYSLGLANRVNRPLSSVRVWDTVPAELDADAPGYGFDDPCAGWTMTPSGCAATTGKVYAAGKTILTWTLDLPPLGSTTLRWKGRLRSTVTAGVSVVNRASMSPLADSVMPRTAMHIAPVAAPGTYVTYTAWTADDSSKTCGGFLFAFYPLNKRTDFSLYGLDYEGMGFASYGGVSDSIGSMVGTCLGGFPGGGAVPGGGTAGCGPARAPAVYNPTAWYQICPMAFPWNAVYRIVSNAPLVYETLYQPYAYADEDDGFAPTSSLSYSGPVAYVYRRDDSMQSGAYYGDSLNIINPDQANPTTVILFQWNASAQSWDFNSSYDVAAESQVTVAGTSYLVYPSGPWKIVSTRTPIIVHRGYNFMSTLACCCAMCGDHLASLAVNALNGNTTSTVGSGRFYFVCPGHSASVSRLLVTNTGAADATYQISRYVPYEQPAAGIPPALAGTSGSWTVVATDVAKAGLSVAGNPKLYMGTGVITAASTAMFKVELTAGGPIQVLSGNMLDDLQSGAFFLHAADGNQTGAEFWFSQTTKTQYPDLAGINVFCPRVASVVRLVSSDGYSALYTTNGPDQVVSFKALSDVAAPYGTRNWRINALSGGPVMAMVSHFQVGEKVFVSPVLRASVSYRMVAPPVVFAGQMFWMTVVVLDGAGATKADYCGTTSFTSTDPGAKIEGAAMDVFNFTWSSTLACAAAPNENGVKIFMNTSLSRIGVQEIMASDTTDGSIAGLTTITVTATDVRFLGKSEFSVQASGDTVQFRACWSNYAAVSTFTFVITDAVPMGTTFLPEAAQAGLDCGNTDGVTPVVAYSTATTVTPPVTFTAGNPISGTRWLRWTVPLTGVQTTGCACFRVVVN